MSASPPLSDADAQRGLELVRPRTEATASDAGRLQRLLGGVQAKMARMKPRLGSLKKDLPALIRLVRSYVRGEYREVPWRSVLLAVGALVYFLTPVDLIPDFLVGVGLLDDAAVVAYVLRMLHDELGEFYAWEREQSTDDPDTLNPPY